MAIKLENKANVLAPNSTYPYGDIKDNSGAGDGTPVNRAVYADFHQFFASLLAEAEGIGYFTTNGLPDNDDNGFQYLTSLQMVARAANKTLVGYVMEAFIGNGYDATKPYALRGLTDSGTAIALGYIYYAGALYVCGGLNYGAIVNDLQFNQTGVNTLTITDSATSGLFQYSDLLFINQVWTAYAPTFAAYTSSDVAVPGGVTVSSYSAYWIIRNNTLFIRMSSIDISTLATVRYVTMSLPTSSFLTGKSKNGTGFCKFAKTTGTGLPVVVNVDLASNGAGDPFMIEKADKTDFGALANYDFRFTIAIALI